jgi:hypothetical protein
MLDGQRGLCTLWDISLWSDSVWAGWKRIEVPDHLRNEWSTLLDLLHGLAPTHMRKKRFRKDGGSNDRGYTVSMGYIKLNERPYVPPDPAPWQGVWRIPSWPKIDFFAWHSAMEEF